MATLRIYQAPSGQWAGQLLDADGIELAGVAGCESAEDVEDAAHESGIEFDEVVTKRINGKPTAALVGKGGFASGDTPANPNHK